MQDFNDPDLLAMGIRPRGKFPFARVLLIVTLVATGAFVAGYYMPLRAGHMKLVNEHEALAKSARTVTDELKRKQEELDRIEQERSTLKSQVTANDERTKGVTERLKELKQQLEGALEKRIKQGLASVVEGADTVVVRVPSRVLFAPNSLKLTRNGALMLCETAKAVAAGNGTLTVATHTATADVESAALAKTYKTVWDVSAAQAAAVASVLTGQCALPAARVTASAHANSRTLEGAAPGENARVDLEARP